MVVTTSLRCCVLIVLLVLTSNSPHVSAKLAILYTGESLHVGDHRLSIGAYTLAMQKDCNLVLRDHSRVIWSTGTAGKGSNCFAKMRNDGNLVVYNYNGQVAIWASNTVRGKDQYQLKLKKNRNLVILKGAARDLIWSTNTNVTRNMLD